MRAFFVVTLMVREAVLVLLGAVQVLVMPARLLLLLLLLLTDRGFENTEDQVLAGGHYPGELATLPEQSLLLAPVHPESPGPPVWMTPGKIISSPTSRSVA